VKRYLKKVGSVFLALLLILGNMSLRSYETSLAASYSYPFNVQDSVLIGYEAKIPDGAHIDIPNGVKTIGEGAFNPFAWGSTADRLNKWTVGIPESVTKIESNAFYACDGLTKYTIPPNVEYIGEKAIGYSWNGRVGSESVTYKLDGINITGVIGSEAEKYAKNNGFSFVAISYHPLPVQYGNYADAYLDVLKGYQININAYTDWDAMSQTFIHGGQVAIIDVCGDYTPELIFIENGDIDPLRQEAKHQLHVWGFDGSSPIHLLQEDFFSYGVHNYALFITSDQNFYVYIKDGQAAQLDHFFTKYTLQQGRNLVPETVVKRTSGGTANYSYFEDGKTIRKNDYEDLVNSIVSKANVLILQSNMYSEKTTENTYHWADYVEPKWGVVLPLKSVQMTYDQAVSYLNSQRTITVPALIANPTSSTVFVNGQIVVFDAYNINDNNYFKLRDIAYVLNGTTKQFSVDWNGSANAIMLTGGQPYIVMGNEMQGKGTRTNVPIPTNSRILLNRQEIKFTAYNINDNNYFKLRDIGSAFNFGVEWDSTKSAIVIDTSKDYTME